MINNKSLKLMVVCMVIMLIIPSLISAMTINIRTLPGHKVSVFILGPTDTYELLESKFLESDMFGKLSTVYSGGKAEVKINIKVSSGDQMVLFEKFGVFPTTEDVYLQLKSGEVSADYRELDGEVVAEVVEEVVEETDAEEVIEETVVESTEESETIIDKLSGFSIFGEEGIASKVSKTVYYVIGGILLVLIAGFVVVVVIRKGGLHTLQLPRINKKDEDVIVAPKEKEDRPEMTSEDISIAEKKLQEAQEEINKLKRIKEIEGKLAEDKKELDDLKRGL